MASAISTPVASTPIAAIPLGRVLPWLFFAALLAMTAVFFIGAEQGAVALVDGTLVHEFVHDGRHLLGYPCH